MTTININASKQYDIVIDRGILTNSIDYVKPVFNGNKILVISDTNVAPLYLDIVKSSLSKEYEVYSFVFEAGEESKNPKVLIEILEYAACCELSRKDLFVALGGGVVGDICGLSASLYMRGVKFVQMPTTLLACVDSSVGGKTAVDLKAGKNLCGAFWQPSLVLCDIDTLKTLKSSVFSDGMAEVIKYGIICDKHFFEFLQECDIETDLEKIISTCVNIKANIVEEDEFDTGRRALLNLGHTFGHAIEKLSNFTISHGSAVAVGCCIASKVSFDLGVSIDNFTDKVVSIIKHFGLPYNTTFTYDEIAKACCNDKKRSNNSISLILPKSIGDTIEYNVSIEDLSTILKEGIVY